MPNTTTVALTAAAAFRQRLTSPGLIRLIGAHNALGAKLAEWTGFEGVWASGLELSASFAVPDANLLSMSEVLHIATSMAETVSLPIVVDGDTGYGDANNVAYMVRKFEAAGVAAVCIEDKLFPKVNSFIEAGQDLLPVREFADKIRAAKNAQRTADFSVIARVEALIAGFGLDAALERAYAYAAAGADAILMHSKRTDTEQIRQFMAAWDGCNPVIVVPTTYYRVTADELLDWGVKGIIYANHGLRASIRAMAEVYKEIYDTGSTTSVEGRIASLDVVFRLQGMDDFERPAVSRP